MTLNALVLCKKAALTANTEGDSGRRVIACIYLAIDYERPLWISVVPTLNFTDYGFMKKRIGNPMNALQNLNATNTVLTGVDRNRNAIL